MSSAPVLPHVPGSGSGPDPGAGPAEPALLDDLLDDGLLVGGGPLERHRELLTGDHRDLVAALVVPASAAGALTLVDALVPGDAGIRVVLAADSGDPAATEGLRAARNTLLDVDAVELLGVRLAIPAVGAAAVAAATHDLLAMLDSSTPAWVSVPPGPAAGPALDVLATDGAENVTLDLAAGDAATVTDVLRRLLDRDLTFRATGTESPLGLLALLCATRAALDDAGPARVAELLTLRDTASLTSAVRRMSAADAAVVRAFLVAVEVPDATRTAADLDALGLVPEA